MAYEGILPVRYEAFSRSRVPPKYAWAWENLYGAIPGWEGGGKPIEITEGLAGSFVDGGGYANGFQGHELNFTANSYVSFGAATRFGFPLYDSVTIAAIHSPKSTAFSSIFCYAAESTAYAPFVLAYSYGTNSQYSFWNDHYGAGPLSGTTFAVGTRNLVIGRRIGTQSASPTLDLFVNGRLLGTTTNTEFFFWEPGQVNLLLCLNRLGGGAFGMGSCAISNVLVWNRALSDAEIECLSEDPYGPLRQLRQNYVFFFKSIAIPSQLSPDTIASSTNLTGTASAIQDDPDTPDGNWLTATSATAATDLRVTFPTPSIPPEGHQFFRYHVRKTAGATVPTISAELLQGNSLRRVLSRNVPVTSTTGESFEALWYDTDLVTTLDGSDVELRLYSNVGFTDFAVGSTPAYSSTGPLLVSSAFLTSNEVTYPATIVAGDLLLCQVVTRNLYMDSGSTMIGADWTAFAGNTYGNNTTRVHQSLYWRIADGTEGGGTIIVRTFGNNQESMALIAIHRFTSANGFAGTPIENVAVEVGMSDTVVVGRTITPSDTNQLAVCAIGLGENFPTFGSMTGATGATWVQRFHTGSSLESIGMQTANVSSGAAITGGYKTFGETADYWSALTFCIVSAPVGVTPINTVEIGAIEWQVVTIPDASVSYTVAAATFG